MRIVIVADKTSIVKRSNNQPSYLESTYNLFLSLSKSIYVQCPDEIRNQVTKYVPLERVWVEPTSRGTAPAIGLAATYAYLTNDQEVMLFAFANQTVLYRDKLLNTLKVAKNLYDQLRKVILIGVAITDKTDKYGYIEVGKVAKEMSGVLAFEMQSFKRHVSPTEIDKFVKTWKYLWDTGYVLSSPKDLLSLYEQTMPNLYKGLTEIRLNVGTKLEESVLNSVYQTFQNTSFSEGVIEKCQQKELAVIPVDLGVTKLFERSK